MRGRLLPVAACVLALDGCGSKSGLFDSDAETTDDPPPSVPSPTATRDPAPLPPPEPPTTKACTPGEGWRALAQIEGDAQAIAMDALYIYFATYPARSIRRVPKRGGKVELVTKDVQSVWQLAVDNQYVYFTDVEAQTLRRAPKAGGDSVSLASAGGGYPRGLAVSEHYVFFGVDGQSGPSMIRRVAKPGAGLTRSIPTSGPPLNLAVDAAETVYWATGVGRTLEALTLKEEKPRTLYTGSSFLPGVATSGSSVFFDEHAGGVGKGGRIARMPAGGGAVSDSAGSLVYGWQMVANERMVAALDRFGRSVVFWPTSGGDARTSPILKGQPSGIAIDENCVYVTTDQPGFVGVLPIDA